MTERISPRVDIAFKKIFGVEENKDLLISLINSIVGTSDQVSDVTLLNPYNSKSFKKDKLSILDIKAKGASGKRFNIEIQISDEADYDKRALYYWAKLYTEQLKAAQGYSGLSKAIGIHILNFTSIPKAKEYHNIFHIAEKNKGFTYFEDLELHTIELNKFSSNANEELADIVAKVKTSLFLFEALVIILLFIFSFPGFRRTRQPRWLTPTVFVGIFKHDALCLLNPSHLLMIASPPLVSFVVYFDFVCARCSLLYARSNGGFRG